MWNCKGDWETKVRNHALWVCMQWFLGYFALLALLEGLIFNQIESEASICFENKLTIFGYNLLFKVYGFMAFDVIWLLGWSKQLFLGSTWYKEFTVHLALCGWKLRWDADAAGYNRNLR